MGGIHHSHASLLSMIQDQAFDPASGAPLASTKEYTPGANDPRESHSGRDQGAREVVENPMAVCSDWVAEREGSLTNGELVSSEHGLLGYFRRTHRQVREPLPELDRAAATTFRKIKAITEDDTAYDATIWYVAAERLAAKGYWSVWMLDHATPRCPHPTATGRCGSTLKFRPAVDGLEGMCASSPNRHGAVDEAIRERVRELYDAAFGDSPDELLLLSR